METQDTPVIETPTIDAPAPAAEPKAAPKPRAPKLVAKIGDNERPMLKYPFPVKAAQFDVTVNGEPVKAAVTAGRGNGYTYLMIKNTSFYVAGHIDAGTEIKVNFPEGYQFDDAAAERKSYYKPKKAKATEASGNEPAGTVETIPTGEATEVPAEVVEAAPAIDAPKAKRRK